MPANSTPRTTEDQTDENILSLVQHLKKNPNDEEIKVVLIEKYDQLIKSLARKFSKDQSIADDLYQVGMIGFLSAICRFDPEFGKSFEAFAIPTMVGEIKRYIRDKTWSVHVPRKVKELGPKIKKTVETLTNDLERSPRIDEIASFIGVPEEDILETMELGKNYHAVSMDSSMEVDSEGSPMTLGDVIGVTDEGYAKVDDDLMLKKAFRALSDREKEVIQHIYFHHLSQKDTGDRLGISQMHVSRLQRRALRKLREILMNDQSGVKQ
ncbi:MAG: RNA polymerase sigma factor SigB [Tuberibacillus sp.]